MCGAEREYYSYVTSIRAESFALGNGLKPFITYLFRDVVISTRFGFRHVLCF